MLTQIHISHLITIEELHLDFSPGTTIISGETGAGKSILIDAIELALGSRASEGLIKPGHDKADVSICFDTSKLPEANIWLQNYELDQPNQECIIRRTISKDGRSRSYINGMPTTVHMLRELSEAIINIHGQHEHQSLLKPEKQRDLLDRYAGHHAIIDTVSTLADQWHTVNAEINALKKSNAEKNSRKDFLTFQLQELEELKLIPNEFATLDREHKQLANADELIKNIQHALDYLADNEEHNVQRLLNHALQALEAIKNVDKKILTWIDNIKSAVIQLNDTEGELHHYLDNMDLDPDRFAAIEQRIGILFNCARKHKIPPNELFQFQEKLAKELHQLENSDEQLDALTQQLQTLEKNYFDHAQKLSQSRKKAAKKLTEEIISVIQHLSLPHAEFHIHFEQENATTISPYGLEKIIFQIKTNAGQTIQPLAKVASGGELSRISLAIHIATAEQHTIPTMIFDEVDTGISGGTAEIVGKLLRKLGETHQILCITHLPQVAAQGHHHLCVEKHHQTHTTETKIQYLKPTEKIHEIARMLGGVEITQKTLAHAREMIENID